MLKTIRLSDKPAPSTNNGSRSTSSRNNDNKQAFKKKNNNNEINGFDGNGEKHTKKSRKSKDQKLAKS